MTTNYRLLCRLRRLVMVGAVTTLVASGCSDPSEGMHSHEHTHSHDGLSGDNVATTDLTPELPTTSTVFAAATTTTAPTTTSTSVPVSIDCTRFGPEDPPGSWTIVYTADGLFVPERLDVRTGDEVLFLNQDDQPVWPASNIHPTHEILSSFDPLEAIQPGDSWSYVFEENGFWRYHNHLTPSEKGIVVSLCGPEKELLPLNTETTELVFSTPPEGTGEALFDDPALLRDYVEEYGPAATVHMLRNIELETVRYCHDAAHAAGRIAYELFSAAAFVVAGHECRAGAMHGAMEAMLAERGTARLADDVSVVCSFAENYFIRHQCLHGIGHGIMAWTSYEIHDALELCESLSTRFDQESCYSGVFMENVVGGLSGMMGHVTEYLLPDDPHFPCTVIADRFVRHCYRFQTSHMFDVFNEDFRAVARECGNVNEVAQHSCYSSYGRDIGSRTKGNPERAIELCRHVPPGIGRLGCISGTVQDRFWDVAGADEAVSLCAMLSDPWEAETCWDTIINRAKDLYSDPFGLLIFCDKVPADLQASCVLRG